MKQIVQYLLNAEWMTITREWPQGQLEQNANKKAIQEVSLSFQYC
jgi:hypothetical protein